MFLAHGLAANDPASGAKNFLRRFDATAWPALGRRAGLPTEPSRQAPNSSRAEAAHTGAPKRVRKVDKLLKLQ